MPHRQGEILGERGLVIFLVIRRDPAAHLLGVGQIPRPKCLTDQERDHAANAGVRGGPLPDFVDVVDDGLVEDVTPCDGVAVEGLGKVLHQE